MKDTSERDEREELVMAIMEHPWLEDHNGLYLGLCPSCPDRRIAGGHNSPSHAAHIADALLAAGYRKAQQVTTVRELHALPTDTVIRTAFGAVFVKDGGWWAETGARDKSLSADLDLPATVLHIGAAT